MDELDGSNRSKAATVPTRITQVSLKDRVIQHADETPNQRGA